MTKIKLLGGILVGIMLFVSPPVNATEQVYAKSAPTATDLTDLPDKSVITKRSAMRMSETDGKEPAVCDNWLVKVLYDAGFRGDNLRQAWAIVMRESGGREDAVSATGDYGMFQFNKVAWGDRDWWNTQLMLTRDYNAEMAFNVSDGGRTWYPWDIDGKGNHKGNYTSNGVYQKYVKWYNEYPCVKA